MHMISRMVYTLYYTYTTKIQEEAITDRCSTHSRHVYCSVYPGMARSNEASTKAINKVQKLDCYCINYLQ